MNHTMFDGLYVIVCQGRNTWIPGNAVLLLHGNRTIRKHSIPVTTLNHALGIIVEQFGCVVKKNSSHSRDCSDSGHVFNDLIVICWVQYLKVQIRSCRNSGLA